MPVKVRQFSYVTAAAVITLALLVACADGAGNSAQNAVPSEQHATAASATPMATSHQRELPTAPATSATPAIAPASATATATPAGHEHMTPAITATPASQTTTIATATPSSTAAQTVEVQILDFSFDPPLLEISAGMTVTFINQGVDHTATSIGEPRVFDSGIMKTGDRFTFTFDSSGTYDYWCLLHPNMLGTIVVQ